ncbi:MAG: molybdopterin-dependent oxidoreductase, partial [Pyrinomonadaceae bacterium]|nr:molybdopterin-dependent oxidoreductase [Pyrinomonadaceae bacterium]
GSPRITNESLYALYKFATEVVGTENYTATDAFSLQPFFENLGGQLATHRDIRHAKTIVLIGGEPEELQPLTGRQIRQAVRNGGAKLIIVNSREIRLRQQAAQFLHVRPGAEDAAVLALVGAETDSLAARKLGVEASSLDMMRKTISETEGDLVVMFGGELSRAAQSVVAQLPYVLGAANRRVLLHPLPLYNNSIGAHDIMLARGAKTVSEMLDGAGETVRALYAAGSFLSEQLRGREEVLGKLDFLVVQELFETETTAFADVVLPAASFAESDGTFTNNDGFVQRVRQSIPPAHQARQDWMITSLLAKELGVDFDFQMSASRVFEEIARNVPAYEGLRYALLKNEAQPVQAKHRQVEERDITKELDGVRLGVESLSETTEKLMGTPEVGHELFKPGTLTGKVPQFPLLAAGNPEPPTVAISPLYQITIDSALRRAEPVAGD